MLGDTLTVTINAVAKTLVKVNQDKYSSEYRLRETDGIYTLNVRHSSYKGTDGSLVDRHNVELLHDLYPVAPSTVKTQHKSYLTFELPRSDTSAVPLNQTVGFAALFTSAFTTKLVNYES
jgi:hypothetical protein